MTIQRKSAEQPTSILDNIQQTPVPERKALETVLALPLVHNRVYIKVETINLEQFW